jgi:2-dehydropantoate 2-reductase
MTKPTFVIIGPGAVGGALACLLDNAGYDVTIVAHGRTFDALSARGLKLSSVLGEYYVARPKLLRSPRELRGGATAIVTVKGYDYAELCRDLSLAREFTGPAIPLLNGVFAADDLAAAIGRDRVIGGVVRMVSEVVEPGVIKHSGVGPKIEIGVFESNNSHPVREIVDAMCNAKIDASTAPDIRVAIWEKLAFVVGPGAVGAAYDFTFAQIRASADATRDVALVVGEILGAARKFNIGIAPDAESRLLAGIAKLPDDGISSLHRDLRAGRRSELDFQIGRVLDRAEKSNAQLPTLRAIHTRLAARA